MKKNSEEVQMLESDILDSVEILYTALDAFNLDDYNYALSLIDLLNYEYKELTGVYYLKPEQVIVFHERKWSIFNA
jgi:hypothetical protein